MAKNPYKYKMVKGRKVTMQRHVMEQHLGRFLTREETVHHKDLDPTNNDLGNLQLMTKPAHWALHAEILRAWHKMNPVKATPETKLKMSIHARGQGNSNARLTDDLVMKIRNSHEPTYLIASVIGLARPTVTMSRNGKRWTHLPMPETKSGYTFLGPDSDWAREIKLLTQYTGVTLNIQNKPESPVVP